MTQVYCPTCRRAEPVTFDPRYLRCGHTANPTTGKAERDKAVQRVSKGRELTVRKLEAYLISLKRPVSGDDATRWLDRNGYGGDYRLIGAVFHKARGWKPVGYVNSDIPRRHARPIRVWEYHATS